ncbi:response regulator [Litoribacillus peritrichatus]|uniref:histidine kinase n=1 Tax=Litoribacillus peritrichatus TaxID=718191 RepID=A0ABP7MTX8_9GAMM
MGSKSSISTKIIASFSAVIAVLAVVVVFTLYQSNEIHGLSNKAVDNFVPGVHLSMRASLEVERSMSATRGWIVSGEDKFKNQRTAAWQNIEDIVTDLSLKVDALEDNLLLKDLDKLQTDLNVFKSMQEDVIALAHTEENLPGLKVLVDQAIPQASKVLNEVTQLMKMKFEDLSEEDRYQLITLLADFRFSFSQGLASIRAYLATNQSRFREEYFRWWQSNTESLTLISVMRDVLTPHQKETLQNLKQERDKFSELPDLMFRYRQGAEWNLARSRAESELFPMSVKVSSDLESMISQLQVRMKDGFQFMNSGFESLSIIGLSLLALAIVMCVMLVAFLTKLITEPLQQVIVAASDISQGNFEVDVNIRGFAETEELSDNLSNMTTFLRRITEHADALSKGNFDQEFLPQGEKDRLGHALNKMTLDLYKHQEFVNAQNWLKSGLAEFTNGLQGVHELDALAHKSTAFVAEYMGAQVAGMYLLEEDVYSLSAGYALDRDGSMPVQYATGEGLIGQTAKGRTRRVIVSQAEYPEDLILDTGVGQLQSTCIVACPVINKQGITNEVSAVLVFGFTKQLTENELNLLDEFCDVFSVSLASCRSRNQLEDLLRESQEKSTILQEQQEELRVNNEELEQQTQSLLASEEELRVQSDELKESNRQLENQKAVLEEKNDEVEEARKELERKAAELDRTSKYKSEFLANMSHELRTPLNSLLILSESMKKNNKKNLFEDQVEDLVIINQAGQVLLSLINDILDLSKVEAGKLVMDFQSSRLKDVIEDNRKQFNPVARSRGVEFIIDLDESCPDMFCTDMHRLSQILRNLLSNAFKFTHQGHVKLSVCAQQGQSHDSTGAKALCFAVEDTGIGVPKKVQKDIFEAFQQADGSTSRAYGGSGLGLTISRELAQLLGGDIELTSEEGKGSTFKLTIPEQQSENVEEQANAQTGLIDQTPLTIAQGSNQNASESDAPLIQRNARPAFLDDDRLTATQDAKTVLIVEDDKQFATVLRDFSRKRGFSCLVSDSGEEALQLASAYHPKAIILDLGLPDISGVKVLERLKQNDYTRDIPVHIISGQEDDSGLIRQGAMDVLHKPVSCDVLEQLFGKFATLAQQQIQTLLFIGQNESTYQELADLVADQEIEVDKLMFEDSQYHSELTKEKLNAGNFDCCIIEMNSDEIRNSEWLQALLCDACDINFPPSIIYTDKPLNDEQYQALTAITDRIVIKGEHAPERIQDEVDCFLHSVNEHLPSQTASELIESGDIDLSSRKVLLVDDDLRNTYALSKVLSEYGMDIDIADNGSLAVDKFQGDPSYDVILMDIMMPVMDGYEAIRCIRKDHSEDVPIIALTAKAMGEDREKCLEAGASDYLSKPVEMDRLISMIKVWVNE